MTTDNNTPGRIHTSSLWEMLKSKAISEPDLSEGYQIDKKLVKQTINHFLGNKQSGDAHINYWLEHGKLAGRLMKKLALRNKKNPVLYEQIGILHDADYYRHPHYGGSTEAVHPAPLCDYLYKNEVPAVVCLAILEHAGYTGEGENFASPMSAAISACDDLATFVSALSSKEYLEKHGYEAHISQLSSLAQELIQDELPAISFPSDFNCPKRVLDDIDLFINNSLEHASNPNLGYFNI